MSSDKTTIDVQFSNRLRSLIEEKLNITQGEFANNVGITAGYLSMVVTGKRGPSAQLIAGIYLNYSKHLNWLLTGKDHDEVNRKSLTKSVSRRKFVFLDEVEEWLDEQVTKNPGREEWFICQFLDSFETFGKWRRKRDSEENSEDESPKRKVA